MKTSFTSSLCGTNIVILLGVFVIGILGDSLAAAFVAPCPLLLVVGPNMTPRTTFISTSVFTSTSRYLIPSDRDSRGSGKNDASEKGGSNSFLPLQTSRFPGDSFISNNDIAGDREWTHGADNGWPNVLAPSIYATSTAAMVAITCAFCDMLMNANPTAGLIALLLVTGTLVWDKFIISLGSAFFRDVENNEPKYKILELLSLPRFISHSLFLPLQCISVAEMGKYAGLGFLQSDWVQAAIVVGAIAVAIEDTTDFVRTNALKLTLWEDSPPDALERDIVKFTYEDLKFKYIIPTIVVSLFTLGVGMSTLFFTGAENLELALWLTFAASTTLIGHSGNQTTFNGNLGEICMQLGFLEAARIVYYH